MKLLTYILPFVIVFLSIKPVVDTFSFSLENHQVCCSSDCSLFSKKQDSNPKSNPKEKSTCNPFQVCDSCTFISLSKPFQITTLHTKIYTVQFFSYQSIVTSQYTSDFWQPPKFV